MMDSEDTGVDWKKLPGRQWGCSITGDTGGILKLLKAPEALEAPDALRRSMHDQETRTDV